MAIEKQILFSLDNDIIIHIVGEKSKLLLGINNRKYTLWLYCMYIIFVHKY